VHGAVVRLSQVPRKSSKLFLAKVAVMPGFRKLPLRTTVAESFGKAPTEIRLMSDSAVVVGRG
jgi:hypothetical protein